MSKLTDFYTGKIKIERPKIKFESGLAPTVKYFHVDCIYIDKVIPDACDVFGSANCNNCSNYVKK